MEDSLIESHHENVGVRLDYGRAGLRGRVCFLCDFADSARRRGTTAKTKHLAPSCWDSVTVQCCLFAPLHPNENAPDSVKSWGARRTAPPPRSCISRSAFRFTCGPRVSVTLNTEQTTMSAIQQSTTDASVSNPFWYDIHWLDLK